MFGVVGLAAWTVGVLALPVAREPLTLALTIGGVVAGGYGLRRNTSAARRTWGLLYLGAVSVLCGTVVRGLHGLLTGTHFPFPSPADIFIMAGYALLLSGEIALIRSRRRMPSRSDALDGLLVSLVILVPLWAELIGPHFAGSIPASWKALDAIYSILTVGLIGATARLAVGPGRRNTSYYLLAASIVVLFLADTAAIVSNGTADLSEFIVIVFPLGFVTFGAAFLHPGIGSLAERATDSLPLLTTRRIALLGGSVVMGPVLVVHYLVTDSRIGVWTAAVGTVCVCLTALTKMVDLVRANERGRFVERTTAKAGGDLVACTTLGDVWVVAARAALEMAGGSHDAGVVVARSAVDEQPMHLRAAAGREDLCHRARELLGDAATEPDPGDWPGRVVSAERARKSQDSLDELVCAVGGTSDAEGTTLSVCTEGRIPAEVERGISMLAKETALAVRTMTLRDALARERGERRFRSLVENSSDIVAVTDASGRLKFLSPAAHHILGGSEHDVRGRRAGTFVHPSDRSVFDGLLREVDESGSAGRVEIRVASAAGSFHWFEIQGRDLRGDPEIEGLVFNAREITDRHVAEEQLARSEARFRALVQNSSDIVAVVDGEGRFSYLSPAVQAILGYRPEELLGGSTEDVLRLPDAVAHAGLAGWSKTEDGGLANSEIEIQARTSRGRWKTLEVVITDLRDDPTVAGIVLNARDVTTRKELESDLLHQATHDFLTGLPNRGLLIRKIDDALARDAPTGVAVLFVDLDNFKTVNDSLGHAIGDELLSIVADRLRTCLRLADVAARLGGDEFAVLLTEVAGESEVVEVADRLLEAIARPMNVAGHDLSTTASVGVVFDGLRDGDPETLLRNADAAMYLAKEKGKGRAQVFEQHMHADAIERLELQTALRRGLEREEFQLAYQPIVDLGTHRVIGVEALLRWKHPERGYIPPSTFVPIAEESGQILELGRWVLQTAVGQLQQWHSLSGWTHLGLSVNLSVRQLQRDEVLDEVMMALETFGIEPHLLQLEITESVFMEDRAESRRRIDRLRELGVRIAVDDFGTGYSSLSYIRDYPVDVLKIDRSFVDGLGSHSADEGVVRTILQLAHAVGAGTVAEGIEGHQELAILERLGCDLGQGYYFAEPMPPDALTALLTDADGRGRMLAADGRMTSALRTGS